MPLEYYFMLAGLVLLLNLLCRALEFSVSAAWCA